MKLKLNFDHKTILRGIVISNLGAGWNTISTRLHQAFDLTEGQLEYAKEVFHRNQ